MTEQNKNLLYSEGEQIEITQLRKLQDSAEELTDFIEKLKSRKDSLKSVKISGNSQNKNSLEPILLEITNCSNLKELDMSDIFVSKTLEDVIECLQLLRDQMNNIKTSSEDLQDAMEALKMDEVGNIPTLSLLNLSHNAIGQGVLSKVDIFNGRFSSLVHLHIDNCGVGPQGSEMLNKQLAACNSLETLTLDRNKLKTGGADIAQLIAHQTNFKKLSLVNNELQPIELHQILQALSNFNILQLDLEDNKLNMEDMHDCNAKVEANMSELLRNATDIQYLNIGDCIARNMLCLSIVDKLKEKTSLKTLNISGNEISDKNIMPGITAVLTNNIDMEMLNLCSNDELNDDFDLKKWKTFVDKQMDDQDRAVDIIVCDDLDDDD